MSRRPLEPGWPGLLALLALLCGLALVQAARIERMPAPPRSYHHQDILLVRYPMVLRGQAWALRSPLAELVQPSQPGVGPAALWRYSVRNPPELRNSYLNSAPLWFLTSALVPAIAGVSLLSARMGPLLVLALALLATWDAARRLGGARAGVAAAVCLAWMPVAFQGASVGVPTLGNLCGVALGLWALVRSQGLRRPVWGLVAGLTVALSTRWGESAGDGLVSALALVGPAALLGLGATVRLLWKRDWRSGLSAALAVGAGVWALDLPWLALHLQNYVLGQAGVSQGFGGVLARVGGRLGAHGWDYPDALLWSLVGPLGLGAVALGLGPFLRRSRDRWLAVAIASSPVGAWVVLTVSEKALDYYAAPMIPALALIGGVGLVSLPRALRWVGPALLGAMGLSWLAISHLDTGPVQRVACVPGVDTALLVDPSRCSADPAAPAMLHYFHKWRDEPPPRAPLRAGLAAALHDPLTGAVIDAMASGSVVLLMVPPASEFDVVAMLLQARRPDLVVFQVHNGKWESGIRDITRASTNIYAVTLPEDPLGGNRRPQDLPFWATGDERLLRGQDFELWRVSMR